MISKKQKDTLKKFFEALKKVSHGPGEIYDLGLIISNNLKPKDLIKFAPQPEKTEVFCLSEKNNPREFLKTLIGVFEEKKWLLIELIDGYLPSEVYNQLRLLSINNRLQIFNLDNKEKTDLKMPKESRVVFLASKESIAKIIEPSFLNLFGPVINI